MTIAQVLPKFKLKSASLYAIKYKQNLEMDLKDRNCIIANNIAGNIIRSFTICRKIGKIGKFGE